KLIGRGSANCPVCAASISEPFGGTKSGARVARLATKYRLKKERKLSSLRYSSRATFLLLAFWLIVSALIVAAQDARESLGPKDKPAQANGPHPLTQLMATLNSSLRPYVDREPSVWFHEVFKPDGSPYRPEEVELIRELTGKTDAKAAGAAR